MLTWDYGWVEYKGNDRSKPAREVLNNSQNLPPGNQQKVYNYINQLGSQGWEVIGDKGHKVILKCSIPQKGTWEFGWIKYDTVSDPLDTASNVLYCSVTGGTPSVNLGQHLSNLSSQGWEVILDDFYQKSKERFCVVKREL